MTSSLQLSEVIRKAANLGATYPQIVAVLENAKRQRNLSGALVVDAVPVSNRGYLEAVLGKDKTGKRDEAVKRTSGEAIKSSGAGFGESLAGITMTIQVTFRMRITSLRRFRRLRRVRYRPKRQRENLRALQRKVRTVRRSILRNPQITCQSSMTRPYRKRQQMKVHLPVGDFLTFSVEDDES